MMPKVKYLEFWDAAVAFLAAVIFALGYRFDTHVHAIVTRLYREIPSNRHRVPIHNNITKLEAKYMES